MHILIGLLGSIISVLYLLDRIGVDLGWINPWSWRRRRAWRNKFEGDPIFALEDPVQLAAVLTVGIAKLEGDLSSEQKSVAISQFEENFSLDARAASQLYTASVHMLAAPQLIESQLETLVQRNEKTFSPEQARSLIEMIRVVAAPAGELTQMQRELTEKLYSSPATTGPQGTWA